MALSGSLSIIWLDAYIGLADECKGIKKLFQSELASAAAIFPVPIDPINQMICCIRELAAPISFASSISDALELIETHLGNGEKVIVITSGSLGNDLISDIQARNFDIHSYYIFCGQIMNHVEWASEKLADGLDIIMFDFEIDLLLRLSRELSNQLIENGRNLLGTDPHSALKYFECARALAEKAVERDAPKDEKDTHRPSISHRRLLDGDNGLIAQAKRACNNMSNS
ncbi:unnamed protein product [Rotaria magnacalcarata]|uniref:Uncharacterized protein n=1 Tax=Rotaria magnacalcarata TaxID=392030 RepID=A0A819XI16_9BILA|nr:unnamed protein product [Rotaria magnacalcarata]CAF2154346.1 unnamed protein product [Rotaria magnacalcarata]CAF4087135.1 unnamed protein product [Rotaria magnacalcarata]CAF4142424.1 unnamed protein product [Rotaria magnacalcarata]